MKRASCLVLLAAALWAVPLPTAFGADPVVIHNPWIVNDRVADTHNITTMGATYRNAYTPDGVIPPANDEAKAMNVYNNQKRRLYHWGDEPPSVGGNSISDPTYTQNVFGWCLCGRHADQACTITNAVGLGQRKIGLPGHWVYEAQYGDGTWHFYDTMTTCWAYKNVTPRVVANCAEIKADASILGSAVADGRACPGFLLCGDTVEWFQGAINSWQDYGSSIQTTRWTGNMDLRSGETYYRGWDAWQNEHPNPSTNADSMPGNDPPYHHECQNDWKDYVNYPYWEPYGQVISYIHTGKATYRRWANGTHTLAPDFRSASYSALLEAASTGIATYYQDSITPDLHAGTINVQGEAIFKIAVPYYITDAVFSGTFTKATSSDVCKVYFSSNGTSWTQVYDAPVGTTTVTNQSLRSNVFALWQTWYIKVQVKGAAAKANAGVSNFVVVTTFEHNKGAMAYLDKGVNHITVTCDNPTALGSDSRLKVTYKWKEYSGSGWTIDKALVKYLATTPATYTVVTGGTKVPRTEYIQMEVVPTPPPDVTAPAAVADLRANGVPGRTSVSLIWTAPGNDGNVGEATGYDLRYSTSPIDESNFASAAQAADVPVPQAAGGSDTFTVTGLTPSTTYYFAIKAFDDDGNIAAISANAVVTTKDPDPYAPNAVTNLAAATTTTLGRYTLSWTAPADNGNGYVATYDLRWSTDLITDANFASATAISGLGTPKNPGQGETVTANGLPTGVMLYFALRSADDSGNWSLISNVPTAKKMMGTMTFQNGVAPSPSYAGCQDTYMSAAAVTTKYEGSTELQVAGMGGGTNRRRAIVKFDITSLPTAVNITKATLYLYASSNCLYDPAGGQYAAYRVKTPWTASVVSWNMPWVVSGGADLESTQDALTPKQTTSNVWYAWDVTTRVRDFIANPGNNNGWVIRTYNDTPLNQDWFYACEYATDATLRPKLVITDDPLIVDTTPPQPVADLAAGSATGTSLTLTWTAPEDYADDASGPYKCASYNLRRSTSPITAANFNAATAVATAAPGTAGTPQTQLVTGLTPNTTYYFAIKSTDASGNVSAISNLPSGTTLPPDVTAPNWVGNLVARPSPAGGVDLTWTAPADYGYGGSGPFACSSYDVRYSTNPISEANFAAATQAVGEPAPQAPGLAESFTVKGLATNTMYYFAVKAGDGAVPANMSEISNLASSKSSVMGTKTLQAGLNGYSGAKDSYIYGGSPTTNYGTNERMTVCGFYDAGGTLSLQRGLVQFDVTSIPAGTVLTSATLYLYSYDATQVKGSTGFYGAYPISRDWTDTQVTWNIAKTGTSWTTGGGDFAATPDGTSPKQAVAGVWYPFDVTARVQAWLAAPSTNFGWVVRCTDEMLHNQDRFYQSETTNSTLRPKLVVSDLTEPVPGDINGDGGVDVVDLLVFVDSFGMTCGVERMYDPLCDFNADGTVDVVDLLSFVENWPE